MSIKQNGGVFGRNPTFNDVTIEGDLIINGEVFTGLDFQGSWNASTNSPALASSVGTNGEFYIVSIAGTTDLNGITNWGIGDWAIFNGTVWQRVEGGADGNFNDVTVAGTLEVTGEITANGGIALGDNDKATFGASDDLQIYHTGSTSIIEDVGTGDLVLKGTDLYLRNASNSNRLYAGTDVRLYHDGTEKIRTAATGIDVTGSVTTTDLNITDTTPNLKFTDTDGTHLANITQSGSHLYVDNDSTGNIRFRVDSNTERLTVNATGIDVIGTITADALTVANSGNGDVYVSRNSGASIHLQAQSATGKIGTSSNHNLGIMTNGSTRLTIDTSGNVGIGTSTPTASLSLSNATNDSNGIKMQASGWVYYARSGINGTSGGQFIQSTNWNANTNAVDSASQATTAIIQDATTGSVQFKTATTNTVPAERMRIDSSGTVLVGTTSEGSAGAGDIVVSGGVYLGGTGAANKLDDYEEGTWTPTLIGSTSGSATLTVSGSSYVKVGSLVTASAYLSSIDLSGDSIVGSMLIGGLPFAVSTSNLQGVSITFQGISTTIPVLSARLTTTEARLQQNTTTTALGRSDCVSTTGRAIMISATYRA